MLRNALRNSESDSSSIFTGRLNPVKATLRARLRSAPALTVNSREGLAKTNKRDVASKRYDEGFGVPLDANLKLKAVRLLIHFYLFLLFCLDYVIQLRLTSPMTQLRFHSRH